LIMYLSPRRMLSSLACAPRAGCLLPGEGTVSGTAPAGGEAVGPMSGVVCMR
jgi:hypothetical protein